LPPAKRRLVRIVDFNEIEQRYSRLPLQPSIERPPEATKIPIRTVAKCQNSIPEPREPASTVHHRVDEREARVRRIAFAVRAHHEQRALRGAQLIETEVRERPHTHRHVRRLQ
jgi:hypothetical protein